MDRRTPKWSVLECVRQAVSRATPLLLALAYESGAAPVFRRACHRTPKGCGFGVRGQAVSRATPLLLARACESGAASGCAVLVTALQRGALWSAGASGIPRDTAFASACL